MISGEVEEHHKSDQSDTEVKLISESILIITQMLAKSKDIWNNVLYKSLYYVDSG